MTEEEFTEQLQTWKKELVEDVVSHYRAGNRERGGLAFERWKERFTRFLKENVPSEATRFGQETRHYGYLIRPGEHPYDTFMREDGNTCFAFIDDLSEEAIKGRLADLQTKSARKQAIAGGNMPVLTDQTLLKVRNDISRRLSRPSYEDLLIELGIYSLHALRDEYGDFKGMTKDQFIEESLLNSYNNWSLLKALLEQRVLDSETKQALIEDGIDLRSIMAAPDSDNVKEKVLIPKRSRLRPAGAKNKTAAARKKSKTRPRKRVVLFLAADPTDASQLRLGEELREIQEKLQLARLRSRFELEQRMSVRSQDISQALLDVKPDIVHFSGHGIATGELCVENQSGETHPIRPADLAKLFGQFANQINCVVLNACHSKRQANAIAKHIKYVIGMSRSIDDKAAIAFAVGFYQALGAGFTINKAYKMGCAQIGLQSISRYPTPVLYVDGKVIHGKARSKSPSSSRRGGRPPRRKRVDELARSSDSSRSTAQAVTTDSPLSVPTSPTPTEEASRQSSPPLGQEIQIEPGYYWLTAKCSGKRLDVYGANNDEGGRICQATPNSTDAQKWHIQAIPNEPGYYWLTAKCSGKRLDVYGAKNDDGGRICQAIPNSTDAQKWYIQAIPNEPGYYWLTAKCSGKRLDVYGAKNDDGGRICQAIPNSTDAQKWHIQSAR